MAKKKGIKSYFELGYLTSDLVLKNLPFVFFFGFLGTIYIANAHYAERNVREIQVLQKELKELRWYYMSLQSENMYNSKQSVVTGKVKKEGLKPMRGKPNKIEIKE